MTRMAILRFLAWPRVCAGALVVLAASLFADPGELSPDLHPNEPPIEDTLATLQAEYAALVGELDAIETELLHPASSRVVVYLSMDVKEPLDIQSMDLEIDGRVAAHLLYTTHEANALFMGGAQQAYLGNLEPGVHRLRATLRSLGKRGKTVTQAAEFEFEKTFAATVLECAISGAGGNAKPTLVARVVR